jgi:Arc/MetJ-type ribon-helix-helix transcriptional regulator
MGDAGSDDRPFPILLEVAFRARLEEFVRAGRARSVSALIRAALEGFDPATVAPERPAQVAISVRLGAETREMLRAAAQSRGTSIGHLVRAAVEAHLGAADDAAPPPAPVVKPSGIARSRSRRAPKPAPALPTPSRPVRPSARPSAGAARPVPVSRPKKAAAKPRARPARKRRRGR